MKMIDLTNIINALLGLAVTLLTIVVIPTIRARIGAQKWDQLLNIVGVAVRAAEQMYNAGAGEDKLDYASRRVHEAMAAAGLKYDAEIVRAAIEAAVLGLKG